MPQRELRARTTFARPAASRRGFTKASAQASQQTPSSTSAAISSTATIVVALHASLRRRRAGLLFGHRFSWAGARGSDPLIEGLQRHLVDDRRRQDLHAQ